MNIVQNIFTYKDVAVTTRHSLYTIPTTVLNQHLNTEHRHWTKLKGCANPRRCVCGRYEQVSLLSWLPSNSQSDEGYDILHSPAKWWCHRVATGSRYCCYASVHHWFCHGFVLWSVWSCGSWQVKNELVDLVTEDYDVSLCQQIVYLF